MRGRRLPYMDRRELSVLYSGSIDRIKYTLWQQLLRTLRPYDETEWKSANFLMKGFLILRAPILIMLKMLIPITDQEEEDSGWSRLLNCVQVVLLPSFISYVTCEWAMNIS